jgi:hypothetical protein
VGHHRGCCRTAAAVAVPPWWGTRAKDRRGSPSRPATALDLTWAIEDFALWTTLIVLVGVASFLLGTLVHSIVRERRASRVRRIWSNFGLSLAFAVLFLVSWAAQGVAEWQVYASEQAAHGERRVCRGSGSRSASRRSRTGSRSSSSCSPSSSWPRS